MTLGWHMLSLLCCRAGARLSLRTLKQCGVEPLEVPKPSALNPKPLNPKALNPKPLTSISLREIRTAQSPERSEVDRFKGAGNALNLEPPRCLGFRV